MVVRLAVCAMPGRGHAAMPATKEMNTRRFMLASRAKYTRRLVTCLRSGTRDAAESHVLRALSRILSEPVMGFLALAALSAGIAPMLFPLPAWLARGIAIAEWAIIAVFAAEYLTHLALAPDRRRFVTNPWRVVDALIILAPLVSLIPWAPGFLRSSPALRVLRLARVILFGARARRRLAPGADMGIAEKAPSGPLCVSSLLPEAGSPQASEWHELLAWIRKPDERWMHAANLDEARIKEIAAVVDLPDVMVDA